jgi:hypothetical protein
VAKKDIVKYVPDEIIINRIYVIRGHKVILDYDLAVLYGVQTGRLNEQVKRNMDRFPEEFMFRLTKKEWQNMMSHFATSSSQNLHFQATGNMRSQFVTSSQKKMELQNATSSQNKRKISAPPFAFTEHGVAMVANVLKSERAVKMSIAIVKTFIQLTKQILNYTALAEQIKVLKLHLGEHDVQLNQIYNAIEDLLDKKVEEQTWQERRRIGFKQK